MKWILSLLVVMLIASPAAAQVTLADVEQVVAASESRILAEFQKMREELATVKTELATVKTEIATVKTELTTVKTEIAVMKTDIAVLKTELHDTKGELKEHIDLRATASEGVTLAEIRSVNRRLSFVEYLLIALVTALVTVLLWMLKNQWDKRRTDREKLAAQQSEIDAQNAEIVRLRAEAERTQNASGLVSPTGGRLENEVKRG